LLAGRSPPLKQAKNNNQDKIAVAAQGLCPLLPIGIFSARRKTLWSALSWDVNPRRPCDPILG
jgi:hypothetical protein